MKLRKLFAWLMTLVMLLGMVPTAQADVVNCDHNWAWRWPNGQPVNCQEWKWSEKYCTKCGVGDGGFEQCGPCVPGDKTWVVPQASNCQEHGVWEICCKHCGEWLEGMEEPGPHKWSETIVEEPWCDVGGMKAMICSVCGEWQGNGTPLEPLGHVWESQVVDLPGCTLPGWEESFCSRCGDEKGDGHEIPPTGHDWGDWVWDGHPDCVKGGWKHRTCKRCRDREEQEVAATGEHNWGSWKNVVAGTCVNPGIDERSCTVCGETERRDATNGDHSYGNWIADRAPTCTEVGLHYKKCSLCGQNLWDTIPQVDHNFGAWYVVTEPEVGIPGLEQRDCTFGCGTNEQREIPALEEAVALEGLELTLTLDSTPANGEFFVLGEQVVFTASWSNLSPFELFPFYVSIWPYEQPSRDSQDLPYSCSFDAEEPITPGMTGSHSMLITVTEEDVARDGIYAMAFIESSVHNGPEVEEVTTPFVTAPCAPVAGSDYATSIKLEIFDVPSVTAEWAGDVYPVKVRVTNTGDTTVDLHDFAFVDANGNTYLNAILYDWNKYAIDPPCDWLPAGASLTTDLEFAVTQDGIAAGELRFNLVQYAAPWYAQVGDQYTDTPADVVPAPEGTTGYYSKTDAVVSDTVEIVVPINQGEDESAAEGLTVTKTASAGSYSDPCKPGDVVTFTITVTNNTGVELHDVEITDPVKGGNEDSVVDIIPSMQPGESVTASFNYTVTEEDATVGVEGFENTAYATGYTADGTQVSGTSETIFVWCVIEHGLTFFKSIANVPANGVFFVPGETIVFDISMFNHTPYPLYNITLTDPLCQDQYIYDAVNDMSYLFFGELYPEGNAMGESNSATVTVSYVVTEADAEAGSVTNTAEVWYQTWYGKEITDSDGATAPCGPGSDDAIAPVVVTKAVANTPANGEYFVVGETVEFSITVTNNSGNELAGMIITDPLDVDWICEINEVLLPGESRTEIFSYVVTELDSAVGCVENYANVRIIEADGYRFLTSNVVVAPCSPSGADGDMEYPVYNGYVKENPLGVITGLEVTKEVESLPLNGLYYTEGEKVAYRITYVNSGETPLTDVMIYDSLAGMTEIASAETLDVGESRFCVFNYTVTAEDVARGYVSNTAVGQFEIDGYLNTVHSDTVVVDTDGQSDPEIPEGILPPGGIIDVSKLNSDQYCRRVTSSRTNVSYSWGTSFCFDHAGIQGNILMMEQVASTPEMQMQAAAYAVALWRDEVEKLYEKLLDAADPQARAVIMTEYIGFLTHAANFEAMLKVIYPDQPALVAQKMANMWEEKCITLCQEMHMPVSARQDSFLAVEIATMEGISDACTCVTYDEGKGWNNFEQNYCPAHSFPFVMIDMLLAGQDTAEAWTTVRQIWNVELRSGYNKVITLLGENSDVALAEYATLENWMIAREAELKLLYPDNPELVAQTMVRIIMDQVNTLCQVVK